MGKGSQEVALETHRSSDFFLPTFSVPGCLGLCGLTPSGSQAASLVRLSQKPQPHCRNLVTCVGLVLLTCLSGTWRNPCDHGHLKASGARTSETWTDPTVCVWDGAPGQDVPCPCRSHEVGDTWCTPRKCDQGLRSPELCLGAGGGHRGDVGRFAAHQAWARQRGVRRKPPPPEIAVAPTSLRLLPASCGRLFPGDPRPGPAPQAPARVPRQRPGPEAGLFLPVGTRGPTSSPVWE